MGRQTEQMGAYFNIVTKVANAPPGPSFCPNTEGKILYLPDWTLLIFRANLEQKRKQHRKLKEHNRKGRKTQKRTDNKGN